MSELGLVTPGGKVVWGKYAQVRAPCLLPLVLPSCCPLFCRRRRRRRCRCHSPPVLPTCKLLCNGRLGMFEHDPCPPASSRPPRRLLFQHSAQPKSIPDSPQVTNNPENDGCINAVLLV